jgi:hypothetical protein
MAMFRAALQFQPWRVQDQGAQYSRIPVSPQCRDEAAEGMREQVDRRPPGAAGPGGHIGGDGGKRSGEVLVIDRQVGGVAGGLPAAQAAPELPQVQGVEVEPSSHDLLSEFRLQEVVGPAVQVEDHFLRRRGPGGVRRAISCTAVAGMANEGGDDGSFIVRRQFQLQGLEAVSQYIPAPPRWLRWTPHAGPPSSRT